MILPLLIGSGIFATSVVVQILALLGLLHFLQRRQRLGRFDENLRVATGALSGGMLIVFVGHLLQVGIWAALFIQLENSRVMRPRSTIRWSTSLLWLRRHRDE